MYTSTMEIYKEVIGKIKNDINTEAILLVGSSKNVDLEKDSFSDIDIFVISNIDKYQVRKLENINGIEFDINYFSMDGISQLIDKKEYFFIKEMQNPKILFDKYNKVDDIINVCKKIFKEGPKKLTLNEKNLLSISIKDKIGSLKNIERNRETIFLTNLYLKDIISGYFIINNLWMPKDKKIFSTLEMEDASLLNLILNTNIDNSYDYLLTIYRDVFKEVLTQKI